MILVETVSPQERLKKSIATFKKKPAYQKLKEKIRDMQPLTDKKQQKTITYSDFYKIAGVSQHAEFEKHLKEILFKPEERKRFYDGMAEINPDLSIDSFKPYFELYAAERKSFQQDYTPDEMTQLLATLTRSDAETHVMSKYSGYDATAGTGALVIQKWQDDRIQETPWSYAPHRYLYRADELADNVIPYLIHNFAMRGMNAIVVNGDVLTGKAKQVYFIQNSTDDYQAYSDINVMPHSAACAKEIGVTEWIEKQIEHIESRETFFQFALPMHRKALEINSDPKIKARPSSENQLKLKHVATIERAKSGKVYPAGTIVVQLSATKGQTGLLKSNGEVGSQYAAIELAPFIDPTFAFYQLKQNIQKHFNRVQEGLNVPLEEIGNCPFAFPFGTIEIKELEYEQLTLEI